jgi:F-box-like
LTINHLPDEVLLEIFDLCRQDFDDPFWWEGWREHYRWFDLAHVCRKWRAIMSGSACRLDLGIHVDPKKPDHIETFLSGPWPIFIDYESRSSDITGNGLWRMLDILRHHDRVREIAFAGTSADLDKFVNVANCPFPMLEGLHFYVTVDCGFKLPDAFLRGPDLSILHLRCLTLSHVTLPSISGFLMSATALTELDLGLHINTVDPSPEMTLLTCLPGMPSLHRLDLSIFSISHFIHNFAPQPSPGKETVLLSKLKRFHYVGPWVLLDVLLAGLSAPSLQDFNIGFDHNIPAIVYLPRFISEIEEHYYAAHVAFRGRSRLLLLTHVEYISRGRPGFSSTRHSSLLESPESIESIMRMSEALFARLVTVEELRVTFDYSYSVNGIPWRRFLRQFPNVKGLRIGSAKTDCIAQNLQEGPGDHLAFLPALEEIELGKIPLLTEESRQSELAAFEPFVSARQQAGRPVKVFCSGINNGGF